MSASLRVSDRLPLIATTALPPGADGGGRKDVTPSGASRLRPPPITREEGGRMEIIIFAAAVFTVIFAAVYTIRLDRDAERQQRQWERFLEAFGEDRRES